jgi:hypothetical protein
VILLRILNWCGGVAQLSVLFLLRKAIPELPQLVE